MRPTFAVKGTWALLAALLAAGCGSSRLADLWRDPSYTGTHMQNILVIAVKRSDVGRRLWEDGFTGELSARGVTATASYALYPDGIPDTSQVEAAIDQRKFDGVLVIERLPTQVELHDVPGYTKTVEVTRYNRWSKTYSTLYRQVQEPGFTDTGKVVRHQIRLWTTSADGHMVWAATGESIDPSSREAVKSEIAGLIVPELAREGFIPSE